MENQGSASSLPFPVLHPLSHLPPPPPSSRPRLLHSLSLVLSPRPFLRFRGYRITYNFYNLMYPWKLKFIISVLLSFNFLELPEF